MGTKTSGQLGRNCLNTFSTENVSKKHPEIYLENKPCFLKI